MSGILDKKQRLIDFSLTSNGYKQIANGDLRFIYATLTDRNAIYDLKQNEYNVADLDAMPFFFETNTNCFYDNINIELDLTQTANFNLTTDVNGEIINLLNNQNIPQSQLQNVNLSELSTKIASDFSNNLFKQQIILTDNYSTLNNNTFLNNDTSLYISKINNQNFIKNDEINSTNYFEITINNLSNYSTLMNQNAIDLSKTSMIEDDRFQYKLNYLFLPPDNLNRNIFTINSKISNTYNLTEERRLPQKIIFKNFEIDNTANYLNSDIELLHFKNTPTEFDSNEKSIYPINYDDILKNALDILEHERLGNNIAKFELTFENFEANIDFVINLMETYSDSNVVLFNKLLFINHGEIFDKIKRKNIQIYSVGKVFESKNEIDIDLFNSSKNLQYIIEDNYLFVNLFTIVIE